MPVKKRGNRVLLLLLACSALAAACDEVASSDAPEPEGRVNAVMASKKALSFSDLCDVAPDPSTLKTFSWPALAAAADGGGGALRWVNVWATWCKPCIEELPMLARVFGDWKKQGQTVELVLLSVDASADAATDFVAKHPGTPRTLQMSDPSQSAAWLESLGLPTGAAIPVHLIVDARGNLVCARSGGIGEDDLQRFRRVLFP